PPIPGGYRKPQHLGHRPRVNPKTPRRFPLAHTFNLNRITNPSVKLHALHPRPLPLSDKGHLLPDFYSGATVPPGRFSEGFSLRRFHLGYPEWQRAATGFLLTPGYPQPRCTIAEVSSFIVGAPNLLHGSARLVTEDFDEIPRQVRSRNPAQAIG